MVVTVGVFPDGYDDWFIIVTVEPVCFTDVTTETGYRFTTLSTGRKADPPIWTI